MKRHPYITLLIMYAITATALLIILSMSSCASHSPHSYKYPKHRVI